MIFSGHTRFSLFAPESKSWVASSQSSYSLDDYREYLFSDERLEPRANVFFNYSLPQIEAAQRDHSIFHVVSFSPELPEKYQRMMTQAAEKYPWLVLDLRVDGKAAVQPDQLARQLVEEKETDQHAGVFGAYRLDDDDLLPVDYFDRMAEYTTVANVGMYVSFGKGITAIQIDGKFYNPRIVRQRMFTAGLLAVCRVDESGRFHKPVGYKGHSNADGVAPVIVDSREPGFFWNRHLQQDTALASGAATVSEKMDWLYARLERLPAVKNNEEILDRFPVLAGAVDFSGVPVTHLESIVTDPVDLDSHGVIHQLGKPSSHLAVDLELDCGTGVKPRNVLISYRFETRDGEPVGTAAEVRLSKNGFRKSKNPAVGFYKYVETAAGLSNRSVQATAPSGLRITSIVVRRWGTPNEVKLLRAELRR